MDNGKNGIPNITRLHFNGLLVSLDSGTHWFHHCLYPDEHTELRTSEGLEMIKGNVSACTTHSLKRKWHEKNFSCFKSCSLRYLLCFCEGTSANAHNNKHNTLAGPGNANRLSALSTADIIWNVCWCIDNWLASVVQSIVFTTN